MPRRRRADDDDDDYDDSDGDELLEFTDVGPQLDDFSIKTSTSIISGGKVHLDQVIHSLPTNVFNAKAAKDHVGLNIRERADRATNEQVLDPRTRLVLLKLLNRGVLTEIHGCISTGKEANVYYAIGGGLRACSNTYSTAMTDQQLQELPEQVELAVKVYKTSILVFKDRERYVEGEFRYRRGYCKHNPRKMVQVWAEKEVRNLNRLQMAGIPSPKPVIMRSHVLVMQFLGKDGWPAPRLKDATLTESKLQEAYDQCIRMMRTMYHQCKLVHADLSEYNMLYFQGKLWIIDVSQSVEHDHPHALDFLRMDCTNINDYFSKKGVSVLTAKELFDFVTVLTIDNIDNYLVEAHQRSQRTRSGPDSAQVQEAVFLNSYIPRTLSQVTNAERDIFERERAPPVLYDKVAGLEQTTAKKSDVDTGEPKTLTQDSSAPSTPEAHEKPLATSTSTPTQTVRIPSPQPTPQHTEVEPVQHSNTTTTSSLPVAQPTSISSEREESDNETDSTGSEDSDDDSDDGDDGIMVPKVKKPSSKDPEEKKRRKDDKKRVKEENREKRKKKLKKKDKNKIIKKAQKKSQDKSKKP